MNVWFLLKLHSLKKELSIVLVTITIIMAMPVVALALMTQTGISAISDSLAAFNPVTHLVELKDPNGVTIKQIQASTVWPVTGYVSQEFGADDSPYQKHHTGIDIANPISKVGDPVTTFMAGKVIRSDDNPNNTSGYGEYVIIDHGDNITSLYGHLSQVYVHAKQDVKPGDIIGLEGTSGLSTGPHVHFEIRLYGIPVNPRIFMVAGPVL